MNEPLTQIQIFVASTKGYKKMLILAKKRFNQSQKIHLLHYIHLPAQPYRCFLSTQNTAVDHFTMDYKLDFCQSCLRISEMNDTATMTITTRKCNQ